MIAEILRPRGNRGEVLAAVADRYSRTAGNSEAGAVASVDGSDVAVELEQAWPHEEHWVLKFAGVRFDYGCGAISRSRPVVRARERGSLPEGEYFRSDLIGCVVHD